MKKRTGLCQQIIDFWEAHPYEWLSFEDMRAKFDASDDRIRRALHAAKTIGFEIEMVNVWRRKVDRRP